MTTANALAPRAASWLAADVREDEWVTSFWLWLHAFKSQRTQETYLFAWNVFNTFTRNMHPGLVEHDHVQAFKIAMIESGLSSTTVNLRLSALSSFYKYICENKAYLRDDNPCEHVKQLKVNPYGKATHLTENQDVELLNSVDRSTSDGIRDYAILLLFLTTGVRLASVANAHLKDFQRQGNVTMWEYVGKGDKVFRKRLPTYTAKTLWEYVATVARKPDDLIFGLERYQIQYMVKRRFDLVFGKGHGLKVHSLRHTAALNASEHGSIRDVRSLLDHESTRVTAIYLDAVSKEQGEKMSEILDSRYG